MNADELMIGDWVMLKGQPKKIENAWNLVDAKMAEKDLQPVPITKEMLKRNHFISDGCEFFSYVGTFEVHIIPGVDVFFLSIFCSNPDGDFNLDMRVEYVHEIQHALSLFQIDMDIE